MGLKITTKPELAIEVIETRTLSEVELGFTREQVNPQFQPGDPRRYGAIPDQPSRLARFWRWLTR